MPDTGAPWNIPYVAGTDLVSDWPTDSLALANAVADGLDAANVGIGTNVVQTVKSDVFSASVASGASTAVTGLTVAITPTSATSKILIIATVTTNNGNGTNNESVGLRLFRGATLIGGGDAAGNRVLVSSVNTGGDIHGGMTGPVVYLDSPASASSVTYSIEVSNQTSVTRTIRVNQTVDAADVDDNWRSVSTITAIEVAA